MQLRIIQRDAAGNAVEATRPMSLAERIDFMALLRAGAARKEAASVLDLSGKGLAFRAVSTAPAAPKTEQSFNDPVVSSRAPRQSRQRRAPAQARTLLGNAMAAAELARKEFTIGANPGEPPALGAAPRARSGGLLSNAMATAERARRDFNSEEG